MKENKVVKPTLKKKPKQIGNDFGVLQITSEYYPFSKTGGLAHVVHDLTLKLAKLGVEVNVFLPMFGSFPKKQYKHLERIEQDIRIVMDEETELGCSCDRLTMKLGTDTKINFYFIVHHNFFGHYSKNLYSSDEMHKRFYFFTKAVLTIVEKHKIKSDIVHYHDWMTSLVPELLKNYKITTSKRGRKPKALLTIHNLAFQGSGNVNTHRFNVQEKLTNYKTLPEYSNDKGWSKINFLRHGIKYSNLISTVSTEYSQEIQTQKFGEGLDAILRSRAPIYGIVNGIDYEYNNPETSQFLFYNYNKIDFENKKKLNKQALLKKLGIKVPVTRTPLLVMTHRLSAQKGFDLILESFEELMQRNIILCITGEGDKRFVKAFKKFAKIYPKKFIFIDKHSEALEHRLYAAGDFFLAPSVYEPCGTGHLKAMIYGCVPIARKVGGLSDTIFDYSARLNSGTGFLFLDYTKQAFLDCLDSGLDLFQNNRLRYVGLVRRTMSQSFSWDKQVQEYLVLYKKLLSTP